MTSPLLIDTHCHLDAAEFDADRDALVHAAKVGAGGNEDVPPGADSIRRVGAGGNEDVPPGADSIRRVGAGGTALVVPAVERANFGAVASVCRSYPACFPAYGIHPLYVERARPEDLDALRETLRREPAVAVGEIGLDRYAAPRDDERQRFYFFAQLEIARELDLPVILHVRKAIEPILKALRAIRVPGGIAHAYNGSFEQAEAFLRLGFKLGFGGALTYPGSKRIRALAARLPLDAIVLETDAPDIPPVWRAGGRTEPADLEPIAAALAELRGMTLTEVAAATTANALQALPRLRRGFAGCA